MATMAYEGYCVYIGFDWGDEGKVTFDTTALHLGKQQLRASFASPAVYLPYALDLLRSGAVPGEAIVSHRFPLSRIGELKGEASVLGAKLRRHAEPRVGALDVAALLEHAGQRSVRRDIFREQLNDR